jgi:iron complex transport system substrate-binding protein
MNRLRLLAFLVCAVVGGLAPADALEFTDALGRKVILPDEIHRVLPAGPPAAIVLYTITPERMVGWVRPLTPEQKEFIAPTRRELAVAGRLTGKEATLGAAEVKLLKPDLIIDIGDLDPQYRALADRIQTETGVPYVVLDGNLAHAPELYSQLSTLLNAGLKGDLLTLQTVSTLSRVDAVKRSAARPARIYYAQSRDDAMPGMGGIDPQILNLLGAIGFNARHSAAGHQSVTTSQVVDFNPDIVLAANAEIARRIRSDPAWRAVRAVAAGKVHVVPNLPFSWLGSPPGVNRLIGLEWLTGLLYPEQPKRDLAADVRAFYRNYYQVDLNDAQLQRLLQP